MVARYEVHAPAKWEYTTDTLRVGDASRFAEDEIAYLNSMGEDGWIMVDKKQCGHMTTEYNYIFCRPKEMDDGSGG